MDKASYQVCGLFLSIREEMLEKLWRMPPGLRSYLIDIQRMAAANERSQCALMEQALPRQSKCKTSWEGLSTFMLNNTPDTPSTGSTLTDGQGPKSQSQSQYLLIYESPCQLHSLD